MHYFKPNSTNIELCLKIKNILCFMKSFLVDKKDMLIYDGIQSYNIYNINEEYSIHLHTKCDEMFIMNKIMNDESDQYMLCLERSWAEGDHNTPTFFNDDYGSDFIFLNNKRWDSVQIGFDGDEDEISTVHYNLLNEEEAFQFNTLYDTSVLDIVQFVQYFKEYNTSFRVWFSEEIEKLYEVLDEKYGISKYNSSTENS